MSTEYGTEFVSILQGIDERDRARAGRENPFGLDISAVFLSLINRVAPVIIYFPPGHYALGRRPDGRNDYLCGPHVQLFFAVNALLQVGNGITLTVNGSLRAGVHQIFGRSRYQRPEYPETEGGVRRPITWSLDPRAGRVVITSAQVPFVRPEWWGALPLANNAPQSPGTSPTGFDSSEALQAAIDAACTNRGGLSPLPVMLGGVYQCCRTLEVRPPRTADGRGYLPVCLILRGKAGIGTGGGGTPTLTRTRNVDQELEYVVVRGAAEEHPVFLRVFPGVDVDFENINFTVSDDQPSLARAPVPTRRIESCVEVRCDAAEGSRRRGILRRVTLTGSARHQLRIIEDAPPSAVASDRRTARRQFVLDSCALVATDGTQGDRELQVECGDGVMVHLGDCAMRTPDVPASQVVLRPDATLMLAGGSVLVEATLFHRKTGPRPSNVVAGNPRQPDFDAPDGQDFFLDDPGPGRAGTHLTVVHCESQSWWLLGRKESRGPSHNTVLVGVSHNNVNWQYSGTGFYRDPNTGQLNPEAQRYIAGNPVDEMGRPLDPTNVPASARPGSPPSVVWRGREGRCVLIGCALGESFATTESGSIFDVGA